MQEHFSYIKDSGDFIKKMRQIRNIRENAILVTADVVALYPSKANMDGLTLFQPGGGAIHPPPVGFIYITFFKKMQLS